MRRHKTRQLAGATGVDCFPRLHRTRIELEPVPVGEHTTGCLNSVPHDELGDAGRRDRGGPVDQIALTEPRSRS